jgi:hypothetical protein
MAMGRLIAAAQRGQGRAGGAVRDRRRHDQPQGAARRRTALRPRPVLRRLAADAADLAPVRFSFEEAEQKKLANELPEDYEQRAQPFVDSLSQEIGRALQYFFTSTPHHKVHYVMLAGGTATLPGLKERVTDLTGFACMVVNPFENMAGLGGARAKLRREAPSYLTACGLAMRRFFQ